MDKVKNLIKEKIDRFTITHSTTMDCIVDCEPYDSLEDCETLDEIRDYLEDYQINIEDAKQELQDFYDIIEELLAELEGK